MYLQKDFEVQGRGVPGRSQTVPNWHQSCKDNNAVSNILAEAPVYYQGAACIHVVSSQKPLLNGFVMLPSSQENSYCIPFVDLSPNNYPVSQYTTSIGTAATEAVVALPTPATTGKNQCGKSKEYTLHDKLQSFLVPNHLCKSDTTKTVLQYNMVSCTSATKTVVVPPTPATKEKDQCGKVKDYIFHEIVELDSETSSSSLKQRVEPFQAVNHETEADKLLDVEGFQTVKQDIDLNRTPLQKPRRKKHRPKVIIEGRGGKTPVKRSLNFDPNDTQASDSKRTEYEKSKILSNSCFIPLHTPNSNNKSMNAGKRKFPNHILAVNYVRKDPTETNLSNNLLSCPGNSYVQDNPDCSQPSTFKVLPENVSDGPKAQVEELIAPQTKA